MKSIDKKFVPGKGYYSICNFCGGGFYGRLNKKYHYACKVAYNNQKSAKMKKETYHFNKKLLKNEKILRSLLYLFDAKNGIDLEKAIERRFQPGVFTGIMTGKKEPWYRSIEHAFSVIGQKLFIEKI
ncbi:MAG: hypothetical protein ACK452_02725 [Bacteroidota bacterium]